MGMPQQKPGRSKQDYGTPPDFIQAVERRFGALAVDLAARQDNKKAPRCVTPEDDSLSVNWGIIFGRLNCWLNPPFADIEPWAAKCAHHAPMFAERGGRILFLVPASVGANWYADHVHNKALVLGLQGRLCFDGKDPYPKDCILAVFGRGEPGFENRVGFDVWRWRS